MLKSNLNVGDTIPAGTIVVITGGMYSSYGITGIFRAATDVVIPGKEDPRDKWRRAPLRQLVVDTPKLSVLLEELDCEEIWAEE
jgi:hypothetical protein